MCESPLFLLCKQLKTVGLRRRGASRARRYIVHGHRQTEGQQCAGMRRQDLRHNPTLSAWRNGDLHSAREKKQQIMSSLSISASAACYRNLSRSLIDGQRGFSRIKVFFRCSVLLNLRPRACVYICNIHEIREPLAFFLPPRVPSFSLANRDVSNFPSLHPPLNVGSEHRQIGLGYPVKASVFGKSTRSTRRRRRRRRRRREANSSSRLTSSLPSFPYVVPPPPLTDLDPSDTCLGCPQLPLPLPLPALPPFPKRATGGEEEFAGRGY